MELADSESLALAKRFLGRTVAVRIDRPLGSRHPKFGFVYETNYGHLPDVMAPDGEGLDAYVLGVATPLSEFTGTCIAIVHRSDDDDDKLVVVAPNVAMTDGEIESSVAFQEKWFTHGIVR